MRIWLQNLAIRTKVALSFSIICLTTTALGSFAIQRMATIDANLTEVNVSWLPSVKALGRVAQQVERYRAVILSNILATDDRTRAKWEAMVTGSHADVQTAFADYEPLVISEEERRLATVLKQKWSALVTSTESVMTMVRTGDRVGASNLALTVVLQDMIDFRAVLDADVTLNNRGAVEAAAAGEAAYAAGRTWVVVTLILAVAICVAAGLALVAGVSRPITVITATMRRLAGGDTAVEVLASTARTRSVLWRTPSRCSGIT